MLEQESIAWLTYCIIFGLISIVLFAKSFLYRHIIPFTLYTVILVISHFYMTFTPYYTQQDIPWRDQEPVLNQLPIVSILIFGGLINWQCAYLNFINSTYLNYKRWGSLHPVVITDIKSDDSVSEKSIFSSTSSEGFSDNEYTEIQLSSPPATTMPRLLLSQRALWSYIAMLIVYTVAECVFVICILALNDPQTIAFSSAICITVMFLLTLFNFIAIVHTCIKCHSKELAKMMEQIKQELYSILFIAFLFTIIMTSTAALSWVACLSANTTTRPLNDFTNWILLKAFLIYIPLLLLLLCCGFRRKNLKLMYYTKQKHTINHV